MKAVFIIDFELFSDPLKADIALFRQKIPPHIPVIWTITSEEATKPGRYDGFYQERDRIFTKPDTDATFKTAVDQNGTKLMDYLRHSQITEGYACGATYYGCVMGGAESLRSAGITPAIMRDLTDFDELEAYDHEEAAEDFAKANIKITDSGRVLAALAAPASPRPSF